MLQRSITHISVRLFPVLPSLVLILGLAVPPAQAEPSSDEDETFATGLVFEPEAVYRSFPVVGTYRAFLPPVIDLSASMPPVGSQGAQSSCVAWATSYGLRGYYENRRRGGPSVAPAFSPSFIYNQIKNKNADCRVGTSISDALELMKRVGTVPLSVFPYDPRNCSRQPDPTVADAARPFKITDWKRVNSARIDDVKGQLYAGNPVVVGMSVNAGFQHLRGDAVYSDTNTDGGGHAMVVVGYDDHREAFKLFNSWSEKWGDHGFGWVDYDSFKARTHGAFVMHVPDGAPAPPETSVIPAPAPLPAPVVAPRPAPAPAPSAAGVSRIEALLTDIPCSVLKAERGAKDTVTVRGVVGDAADRDRLAGRLRKGGLEAALDVAVMPWPQCEVRGTFAPALERPNGLAVHIRSAGSGRPVLTNEASLVLDVTMPSNPAYLYVIYLDAGGDAAFLYTPGMAGGRPLAPETHLTLGDGSDGQAKLAISPPFGEEMILAVAAPYPLTSTEPPATMTEREFLSTFRLALLGHGARGLEMGRSVQASAAYALLSTRQR